MMDIITALKENERPFGLMTKEMQAKANEMGVDLQKFCSYGWDRLQAPDAARSKFVTYRLRPDYEEKPEIVECEVVKDLAGDLCVCVDENDPDESDPWPLTACPNHPDFLGFKSYSGYVWGNLYRHKETGELEQIIPVSRVGQYEVDKTDKVLFRSKP